MVLVITYPFGQETLVWTLHNENRLTIKVDFSFTRDQHIDDYHFCFKFIENYVSNYILFDDEERSLMSRGTIADKYKGNFYLVLKTKEKLCGLCG